MTASCVNCGQLILLLDREPDDNDVWLCLECYEHRFELVLAVAKPHGKRVRCG